MSAVGVSFSEVMRGHLAVNPGTVAGSPVILRARIIINDLEAFLEDPSHGGSLEGAISLPALSCDWLPAEGKVELFAMGRRVGERIMRYQADFLFNGVTHALIGDKFICDDPGFDAWQDVTRLHAKVVRKLPNGSQEQLWSGVMTLSVFEAARLMTTFRGTGDAGCIDRFCGIMKFIAFFVREVTSIFLLRALARFEAPQARVFDESL